MPVENNPYPFRVPTAVDTSIATAEPFSTNSVLSANKFQGVVLQTMSKATAGGPVYKLLRQGVVKTGHLQEVVVRCEVLHAHLDSTDIERHKPVVMGFVDQSLNVGSRVEIVYKDPFKGIGGVVVKVLQQGDGSGEDDAKRAPAADRAEGSTMAYGKLKKWSMYTDTPEAVGVKNTVPPPYPLEAPFTVGFVGVSLAYVRAETLKRFQKIAEFAGWFYGASNEVNIRVQSAAIGRGVGDNVPSFHHGEGFAFDFAIIVDGSALGPAESYAFVAACMNKKVFTGGALGAYLNHPQTPDKKGRSNVKNVKWQAFYPHHDIRKKTMLYMQDWNNGKHHSTAGANVKRSLMATNALGLPQDLSKRIIKIDKQFKERISGCKTLWQQNPPTMTNVGGTEVPDTSNYTKARNKWFLKSNFGNQRLPTK